MSTADVVHILRFGAWHPGPHVHRRLPRGGGWHCSEAVEGVCPIDARPKPPPPPPKPQRERGTLPEPTACRRCGAPAERCRTYWSGGYVAKACLDCRREAWRRRRFHIHPETAA